MSARGETMQDHGVRPQWMLGYAVDLPWLTLGARTRLLYSAAPSQDEHVWAQNLELGLGLTVERFVDLPWFSLSFGIWGEATYFNQKIDAVTEPPDRHSIGGSFGGFLALEREIVPALGLRFEGGPVTQFRRQAITRNGVEIDHELVTPFTWWLGGGLTWRFWP